MLDADGKELLYGHWHLFGEVLGYKDSMQSA